MARVAQSDLEPGMVVASDVRDPEGRLLVAADTALTEKLVSLICSWGIDAVEVREAGEGGVGSGASGLSKPEEIRVRTRFRHTRMEHPLIEVLVDLAQSKQARLRRGAK